MSAFLLNQIKIGEEVLIAGFDEHINFNVKRRLLELGFLYGTKIKLSQKSFLNEVLLLELNNYTISLRSDIAKNIYIKKC